MEAEEIINKLIAEQMKVCIKYNAEFFKSSLDLKIGISKNLFDGEMPINGLRHPPENGTAGWFIWAGDWSNAEDFFVPYHIYHLLDKYPLILKYLALPPGYRFQIDNNGYEDVWEDKSLLIN